METSKVTAVLGFLLFSFVCRLSAGTHSADPMCSNDHTGGLGCNFERGICGGVVTQHGRANWVRAHTETGPLSTHVDAPGSAAREGYYIYLDSANTRVETATLELFLSPEESSICLLLHYATTGNESLVLRVVAQYETGNRLLEERVVQTFGQWEQLFLPLCLVGDQRSFVLLEIEGFSENTTIALDHLEITRSLRPCDGDTFNLHCSRDRHFSHAQKNSTQSVSQQSDGTPTVLELQKLAKDEADPIFYLDQRPASIKLSYPPNAASEHIYLSLGYTVQGAAPHDLRLRVYLQESRRTTLLMEAPGEQVGYNLLELVLDCCTGDDGVKKQIIIEGSHGKMASNATLAINFVALGKSQDVCPAERPMNKTATQATPTSVSSTHLTKDNGETATTTQNSTPGVTARGDVIETAEEVTQSTTPVTEPDSVGPEHIAGKIRKQTASPASSHTTPATALAVRGGNSGPTSDGLSGEVIGVVASCVSVAVILVCGAVGVLVWRRRRRGTISRKKTGSQKQVLFRASGDSRSRETAETTAAENPIYGSHACYAEPGQCEEPDYAEIGGVSTPVPVLVLTNPVFGGISKA